MEDPVRDRRDLITAFGVLAALGFSIGSTALGQRSEPQGGFEVASVKRSGPGSVRGSRGGPGTSDPGRYAFSSATLLDLIAIAYDVEYFQVRSSFPLDRDRYDVVAIVPAGATKGEFHGMLRRLLAERFSLGAHLEKREFPSYELRVAKTGSKLRKQGTADMAPEQKPGGFERTSRSLTGGSLSELSLAAYRLLPCCRRCVRPWTLP